MRRSATRRSGCRVSKRQHSRQREHPRDPPYRVKYTVPNRLPIPSSPSRVSCPGCQFIKGVRGKSLYEATRENRVNQWTGCSIQWNGPLGRLRAASHRSAFFVWPCFGCRSSTSSSPPPIVTGKGGGGGARALVAEAVFPLCCNLLLNLQVSIIFTNTVWPGPMQGGLFATRETIS